MLINDDVFPFRFQVDRNLVITEVGSSLTKLCKQFRQGATLAALIRFCCPETDVTYSDITQLQRQPVELELSDSGVRMQGQIVVEEDVLCFLGAPEFESPHELERHGLTRADFAIQDSAVQNMMLRWHHNSRLEGLRKALDELEVAATRKANLACVEDTLANELGSAGDLVLQIDMDGRILDLRTSRCDRLPGERGELIGMLLRDRLPGLYRSLTGARHEHARVGVTIGFEFKLNKLQNEYVYDARATRTAHDVMVILAKDVTETKRLEHHLRRQASHDVLTGLPNRTMVEREVQQALTSGGNQAVLLFELDDFKAINERHGHHTGDKLLVEVARVLRRGIRANDFVARLGGDEFAVLLRNIRDHKQATLVAERVLESINRVFQIDEMCARVSASVGVATNKEAATAEELFRNADIAMYRAKSRAKERANLPNPDRIELFESHMYADFVERFTLRQELDQGLDRGEIVNHYQTIHQLETGRIRGIEALARWNHPTRGMLVPAEFIEIAEESGLIIALGEAVLMNACRDARVLASKFRNAPVSVHVNISPIQIAKSDIVATVREALARFELEPQFLTLEITEKALFAGFEQAERVFTELKSIGVNVALDDFGVGYCSLKYLERFPIDFLKLDGSFIHELGRLEAKNRLVQSIVNLGRALDMEIIAEGVEKVVQAQFLRQYGCHNVQGFLYTRPMPFELLKHHVTCQIFDIHADAHIGVAADGTRTDEGSREASQNTDTSTAISQPWLWSEPETGTTVETVHGNGSYSDGDDPECIGESAIQAYCQLSLKDVQN